jgi:hypothetical protein
MKKPNIKNELINRRKLSFLKVAKYSSLIIGAVILICILVFIFFADPIINTLLKDRITKTIKENYPAYSIRLTELHYNIWKNRLACDSIKIQKIDSSFSCSVTPFSVSGISWMKIFLQRDSTSKILQSLVIDAGRTVINFNQSQTELRFRMLHISVPDSEMTADSIKYFSLLDDEQFFAKSRFRQTRFRFDIPKTKIMGLDYLALLHSNRYSAKQIRVNDVITDILVNMDKPYNKNSPNPQMPNEILSSMSEIIMIDSLTVTNARLKYCERYVVRKKPGEIIFDNVNVSVKGIANHSAHPDTAVINGEGLFMNSATMKMFMAIPLASKDFSLRYSGSLSKMDLTKLNVFLEAGEYRRIKSGILHSANFNINVRAGRANGSLRVMYENISLAIIDKDTGSDKGIFNSILSFFGKVFVIRGSNMPDEKGLLKIGNIRYTRDPEDYFLQYVWFALRNGIADVVGFPPK